jgi:hypothetical protein
MEAEERIWIEDLSKIQNLFGKSREGDQINLITGI